MTAAEPAPRGSAGRADVPLASVGRSGSKTGPVDRDEAEALVKLIEATHGLSPRIRSGDEPDSWEVDVDVPPTGAALRETITVSDRDDWDGSGRPTRSAVGVAAMAEPSAPLATCR